MGRKELIGGDVSHVHEAQLDGAEKSQFVTLRFAEVSGTQKREKDEERKKHPGKGDKIWVKAREVSFDKRERKSPHKRNQDKISHDHSMFSQMRSAKREQETS